MASKKKVTVGRPTATAERTGILYSIDKVDKFLSLQLFNLSSLLVPRSLFILLEEGGDGLFWLVGTILLFLWPDLPAYERMVVANLFIGLLVDLIFIGTSKAIFRRPRPDYNARDMKVIAAVDNFSFPSGHSSRVGFVVSYFLVVYHAASLRFCIGVVVWGVITAFSRACMGRHYIGDIIAGLLLGLLTTAVVTKGTYSELGVWVTPSSSVDLHNQAVEQLTLFSHKTGLNEFTSHWQAAYQSYVSSLYAAPQPTIDPLDAAAAT